MRVHKVRQLGNSLVVAVPRYMEDHGFRAGADICLLPQKDGSLVLVPMRYVRADPARVLGEAAAPLPTSASLILRERVRRKRMFLRRATFRARVDKVRVVGSVAAGTAATNSEIVFLVRVRPKHYPVATRAERLEQLGEAMGAVIDHPVSILDEAAVRGPERQELLKDAYLL